jgi:hypothetical protein
LAGSINSRSALRTYILERLGEPINRVNVTEDQLQARIDDALDLYSQYSPDAKEKTWIKYEVTEEDETNGYIKLPETEKIVSLLSIRNSATSSSSSVYTYGNTKYRSSEIWRMIDNDDIIQYYSMMQTIQLYDDIFGSYDMANYEFNPNSNGIIKIKNLKKGQTIYIEGLKIVDFEKSTSIWNDQWIKNYATALVQYQWGFNLSKYSNVPLIGGITVNGNELMQSALQEKEKLEEQIKGYEAPLMLEIA